MKTLFITGTDTGIGKTLVSALICRELKSQGFKVGYMKPVQTGCIEKNGELVSPDVEFVKKICGDDLPYCSPYSLSLPASPHLAAQQEGIHIKPLTIFNTLNQFSESGSFDYVVTEGAGGLAVPLNKDMDMAGLCKMLFGELILVTTVKLGTLNHTKLTLEYAKSQGLDCSVVINGCTAKPDAIEQDNINLISKMFNGKVLCKVPYFEGLDTEGNSDIELPVISLNQFS